jgi:hypothetical protein
MPKPPAMMVAPSGTSVTASSIESWGMFFMVRKPPIQAIDTRRLCLSEILLFPEQMHKPAHLPGSCMLVKG